MGSLEVKFETHLTGIQCQNEPFDSCLSKKKLVLRSIKVNQDKKSRESSRSLLLISVFMPSSYNSTWQKVFMKNRGPETRSWNVMRGHKFWIKTKFDHNQKYSNKTSKWISWPQRSLKVNLGQKRSIILVKHHLVKSSK